MNSPKLIPKRAPSLRNLLRKPPYRLLHRNAKPRIKAHNLQQRIRIRSLLRVLAREYRFSIFPDASRATRIAVNIEGEDISLTLFYGGFESVECAVEVDCFVLGCEDWAALFLVVLVVLGDWGLVDGLD